MNLLLNLVSWAGFATTLAGVWLVARKRISGWPVAAFSEVLWMTWAALVGGWALFALAAALVVLNVHGWCHWHREATVADRLDREVSDG